MLLVSTPIGVIFGLREAWRLAGPGMAVLMAAMISVVGGLVWMTVRRIRQEQSLPGNDSSTGGSPATGPRGTERARGRSQR